jgi:ABC-type phosphate transport system substrate-binding protein
MNSKRHPISLATLLFLSSLGATSASAQTAPSLLIGGASMIAPLVSAEISLVPTTNGTFTYFSVGSGAGETAFLNNDPTKFTSILPTGVTLTASGAVDFVFSGIPLLSNQISAYDTGSLAIVDGPLIQIPYLTTPIAIPLVNAPTGTGPAFDGDVAHTPTVALNDADLCGIFSGAITDWSKVTNPDTGTTYAPGTITVVYRTDDSGSTDLLTAHLAQVCPKPSGTIAVPVTFSETQIFANLFLRSTPPSNFVGVSGSDGVAAQLISFRTAGVAAVGYLSPDYTNTFLAPSTIAPAHTNQLAVASLRNTSTGTDVLPTFLQAEYAVDVAAAPPSNPVDPTTWVPRSSNPSVGYPISGTVQIILSQCYARGNVKILDSPILAFLDRHYYSNGSLLNAHGFASIPTVLLDAINDDILFIPTPSNLKLNIYNVSVCMSRSGR